MTMPTTLAGWLALLEARHDQAPIQLGLARVAAVRAGMACDSQARVITVGGTNGKGSSCAMLESILRAEGYRVGLYTSPHLLAYNERVRLDGQPLDDERLVEAFAAVEAARGEIALTYFEQGTLAAWWAFCQQPLDVIVLEVGLGGRLDAVNVFDADCALVTGVALDHQAYLGDTLEAIGFEKAGIFRAGRPAVFGAPQVPESVLAHAAALGTPLWVSGRDFGFGGDRQQWGYWRYAAPGPVGELMRRGGLAYPTLRGANQLLNASAVLTVLECLREVLPVSMQAVRQGLMLAEVPGRFQVLPGQPAVVLDVAHNPQAAGVLAENLGSMGFFPETWCVLGVLADKDARALIERLAPRVTHWRVCALGGARGRSAPALAAAVRDVVGPAAEVACFDSPGEAFAAARDEAGDSDRIVVCGSFLTVAEVLDRLRARRR